MRLKDVPADLLDLAWDTWQNQSPDDELGAIRATLAAVLPAHERQVREDVAVQLRADAASHRAVVQRKPSEHDAERLARARMLEDAASRITRPPAAEASGRAARDRQPGDVHATMPESHDQNPDFAAVRAALTEAGENMLAAARNAWVRIRPALAATQDEFVLTSERAKGESDDQEALRRMLADVVQHLEGRDATTIQNAVWARVRPELHSLTAQTNEQRQRAKQFSAQIDGARKVASYWRNVAMAGASSGDPADAAVAHACATILSALQSPEQASQVLHDLGIRTDQPGNSCEEKGTDERTPHS